MGITGGENVPLSVCPILPVPEPTRDAQVVHSLTRRLARGRGYFA
jgi:hypothetical protein